MSFTDPIGDMLTRIRNASRARHEKVLVPSSRLKIRIAEVLKRRGLHQGLRRPRGRPQGAITDRPQVHHRARARDQRHQARLEARAAPLRRRPTRSRGS